MPQSSKKILIGLGANLPSLAGNPRQTLEAAVASLGRAGLEDIARSRWFATAPVPASDQPWFVNGVMAATTAMGPEAVLALLLDVESRFGRQRRQRWEARAIDLDLLAYDELVLPDRTAWERAAADPEEAQSMLFVPHPRLHERRFVLAPLADLAPDWRHPVLDASAADLLAALPEDNACRPMPDVEDAVPPVQGRTPQL